MHGTAVTIGTGYVFSIKMNGKKKQVFIGAILILPMIIIRITRYGHQKYGDE
jgi:hypothetical protein